jgi:hypothetical protein
LKLAVDLEMGGMCYYIQSSVYTFTAPPLDSIEKKKKIHTEAFHCKLEQSIFFPIFTREELPHSNRLSLWKIIHLPTRTVYRPMNASSSRSFWVFHPNEGAV